MSRLFLINLSDNMSLFSLIITVVLLLFPFGQITRIELSPGVVVYWHDFIIFLFLIVKLNKSYSVLKNNRSLVGFLIFSLGSLLMASLALPLSSLLISSLYLCRLLMYILFFFVVYQFLPKKHTLQPIILISIFTSLILSFIQYVFFPSFEFLYQFGWDRHNFRLAGTWLDVNFTGLIIVFFLIWFLHQYIENKQRSIVIYSGLFLTLTALLLTYSRSSYIALITALGVYFFMKKNFKLMFLGLLAVLPALPFLPRRFGEGTNLFRISTVIARLDDWQNGWQLFTAKPFLGYGFDTLRYIKHSAGLINEKWLTTHSGAGLDNSLLFLLVTSGVIGAVLYCKVWWNVIKFYLNNPKIMASLSAVAIHGMFSNSWFYPWVLLWLFIILWEEKANSNTLP